MREGKFIFLQPKIISSKTFLVINKQFINLLVLQWVSNQLIQNILVKKKRWEAEFYSQNMKKQTITNDHFAITSLYSFLAKVRLKRSQLPGIRASPKRENFFQNNTDCNVDEIRREKLPSSWTSIANILRQKLKFTSLLGFLVKTKRPTPKQVILLNKEGIIWKGIAGYPYFTESSLA